LHEEVEPLIHKEALCQIRLLALDPVERTRTLAFETLKFLNDVESVANFQTETWVSRLGLKNPDRVTKLLMEQNLTMDVLLSLDLSSEDLRHSVYKLEVFFRSLALTLPFYSS